MDKKNSMTSYFHVAQSFTQKNLYMARHLNWSSPVENTYNSSKIGKQTILIKEATSESSDGISSVVSSVVDHTKATADSLIFHAKH